ncbi:MAG: FtsQ-type POTRA domain-containing protein [Hellea sp.]|nr:FtsQ-type POTRA domain-containing protein [Hellea sp.]
MATIKRVSPLKPGLRGARNWATAQLRAANYSRKGFWRLALSVLGIFLFIGFIALWLGGLLPDAKRVGDNFTKDRLMSMGFVVERVDVMGEGRISEKDVLRAVGVKKGDYLFALDLKEAQARVENLSWVERAIVRRLWPDRIVVQIIERKSYALWQSEGEFYLIDREGGIITQASLADHSDIPLIVGASAPEHFEKLNAKMANYPLLKGRVDSFVRHNTDRWDIIIDNGGMRVKLPADNVEQALTRLTGLQKSRQILDRKISVIDMRLDDRITLSPATEKPA